MQGIDIEAVGTTLPVFSAGPQATLLANRSLVLVARMSRME
jgi:hypothetical protein